MHAIFGIFTLLFDMPTTNLNTNLVVIFASVARVVDVRNVS